MHRARADVLIVGGGVLGLWVLRRLTALGVGAVLLEKDALGAAQTLCSQGIIHGGMKYALSGEAAEANRAIAEMPARWEACLRGAEGCEVDLRGARVLSKHQYLWTSRGIAGRLAGVAASKVIRTDVEPISADEREGVWARAPHGVGVYRVAEPVLETTSLVRQLVRGVEDRALHGGVVEGSWRSSESQQLAVEAHGRGGARTEIAISAVVLCAGKGTGQIVRAMERNPGVSGDVRTGLGEIQMQLRPLHQGLVRGAELPEVYAHCVGMSGTPRVTITSARDSEGRVVWHLGGEVSEKGVDRMESEQVDACREVIAETMGWVDMQGTEWSSYRVDRAEGRTRDGKRPEGSVVQRAGNVIAAWPTKLALAPQCADEVVGMLDVDSLRGGIEGDWSGLARAEVGKPPWEEAAWR